MTSLASTLRSKLEKVVVEARDIAEEGTRAAIEALAVHHHEPYGHMSPEDRALRSRLRAHARQLGDRKDPKTGQKIDRLVTECAYEHWHRMLFARFLAENHLLIEPESGVAISLEECEEIAKEEGVDPWALASRYAQQMLPQIFRQDNPVLQIALAREYRLKLEKLLDSLDPAVFTARDSLGWVYQFWQSKKKEEVNKSGKKIGADELPAVTQLFTEPYMVSFLLDNSLGAWWAARRLKGDDLKNANTEEELRCKAAIPGVPLKYLRFVHLEDGSWTSAAGTFDGWPESLSELKILDPCCGSGHFLVSVFLMLVPMRMELEGLSAREAVDAVLRENIHGLEIDQRCVELAAFALAFTAWKYPGAYGYRMLPELNVACSGLSISAKKDDWLALAGDNINLRLALEELYKQFKDAPVLGSLINPEASLGKGSLFELNWKDIGPLITKALSDQNDEEKSELGVVAKGTAKAAKILADQFYWITTNVPFKETKQLSETTQDFIEKNYAAGKANLATAFVLRIKEFLFNDGTASIVTPHEWLFLKSYSRVRENLLKGSVWNSLADLGEHAFESSQAAGAFTALISFSNSRSSPEDVYLGINATTQKGSLEKRKYLIDCLVERYSQKQQLSNPDYRIGLFESSDHPLLSRIAGSYVGLQNGDTPKFVFYFFELNWPNSTWNFFQLPCALPAHFTGREGALRWEQGKGELQTSPLAYIKGKEAWNKSGVAIRQTRTLPATLYSGDLYDQSSAAIVPANKEYLPALWAFCTSPSFHDEVRKIDKKKNVTNATLVKIPFDIDHWTKVSEEKYPNGLPKPYSDDPTQWTFHGHPCGSVTWDEATKWTAHGPLRSDNTVLQVAVARLLGYRWPAELDPNMDLAEEQREWASRCKALLSYSDDGGIICLPAIRKEDAAADRLAHFLSVAYGSEWSPAKEHELLVASGSQAKVLDDWLRNDFFEQHCILFAQRPFIWHIWDGRKRDGFHALVNYHKLVEGGGKGRRLLEMLTYSYLGDWIKAQRDGIKQGTGGAEDRLSASLELEKRLKAILAGEPPFDIFVRWKPIEEQPIGWEPDINDGVRLNLRPFMADDIPGGRTGAGILRWAPNIKWDKDRGKDIPSAPWYPVFKGERINDHHLTIAEKWAAREAAQQEKRGKG